MPKVSLIKNILVVFSYQSQSSNNLGVLVPELGSVKQQSWRLTSCWTRLGEQIVFLTSNLLKPLKETYLLYCYFNLSHNNLAFSNYSHLIPKNASSQFGHIVQSASSNSLQKQVVHVQWEFFTNCVFLVSVYHRYRKTEKFSCILRTTPK